MDKKADYINKKGASNAEIETKILKLLEAFPSGARRRDIDGVCYFMLSATLTREKKDEKIQNILTKLKKLNLIYKIGSRKNCLWFKNDKLKINTLLTHKNTRSKKNRINNNITNKATQKVK